MDEVYISALFKRRPLKSFFTKIPGYISHEDVMPENPGKAFIISIQEGEEDKSKSFIKRNRSFREFLV